MAASKALIISLVITTLALLCKLIGAATGRTAAIIVNGTTASSFGPSDLSDYDDGICKLLVRNHGYTCEEHTVTTFDGYILSLQRIPVGCSSSVGRSTTKGKRRTPVLLQHGVLMDGMSWLLLPPSQALALVLAENGYDVWIANSRGTKYSGRHVSLSANDKAYWDWTWDEQVKYDLPATIGYVHSKTGQKMHYIGHSLGTLLGLAALSKGDDDPLVINMLRSATSLCPVAYLGHLSSFLSRLGSELFLAEELHWLDVNKFDPKGMDVANLLRHICEIPGVNCRDLMTATTGKNCCLQTSSVEVYLRYEPQPTSMKNMIHIAQMVRRGTLAMYDYDDEDENMRHYGQPTAPDYELKDIPKDFPLFFSYGGTDELSDVRDVRILLEMLMRSGRRDDDGVKGKFVTQYVKNFAHADFIMAGAAKERVYDVVLSFLKLH